MKEIDPSDFERKKPKKRKLGDMMAKDIPEHEKLNDKVTPLWRLPYEKQLERKQSGIRNIMNQFKAQLDTIREKEQNIQNLSENIISKTDINEYLLQIIGSKEEARFHYRTKCEFTIGCPYDDPEHTPVVGFNLGTYKDGDVKVVSPKNTLHTDKFALSVVEWVTEFLKNESKLPVYDNDLKEGFWRLLVVRTHTTKETMVLVQVNDDEYDKNLVEKEKKLLCSYLEKMKDSESRQITTLLWQTNSGCHNGVSVESSKVLFGPGYVYECLGNSDTSPNGEMSSKFRISLDSFFQSNTHTCNELYNIIGKWANQANNSGDLNRNKPIILDLCCGTGTIGIYLSKMFQVHKIVGIEMCKQAVDDAHYNAEMNGIDVGNEVKYYCMKVEDGLKEILTEYQDDSREFVAILDPPRAGVHKSVIKAIRECQAIKKLIYVSCQPKSALLNWIQLSRPNSSKFRGNPFRLQKAQPVDMFPQTDHCELVLEFMRD